MEVDEALVDAHLVAVPGLGTLTARRLAGGDGQDLGGQANGALDAELLVLGTRDKVGADWRARTGVSQNARETPSCESFAVERITIESASP